MHPDELAFYRAIWEAPYDDAPRLIFADWLDEHGEYDKAIVIREDCECGRSTNNKKRRDIAIRNLQRSIRGIKIIFPFLPLCNLKECFNPWIYAGKKDLCR